MTEENSNSKGNSSELLLPSIAWYAVKTLISPLKQTSFGGRTLSLSNLIKCKNDGTTKHCNE